MKIETLKAIVNMFNAASTDETRFVLNHVRMTSPEKGKVLLQASDGYVLSEVILEDETLASDIGKMEYAVAPHSVPYLKLTLKACKHQSEINHVKQTDDDSIVVADGNASAKISKARNGSIEFPDFERVKVMPKEDAFTIGLNVEYLENLLKSMRSDSRQKVVKLTFGENNLSPVKVEVADQAGLIMPCRV